jgi:hypothetical protein
LGEAPSWSGKLALPSDDPRDAVTASFHFDVGSEGGVAFLVPLKLGSGETATDLSAEGKWSQDENGPRLYLKLNGENVRLENLRLLAGPLAQAGHAAGTGAAAGSVPGPFWGDWVGTLQVASAPPSRSIIPPSAWRAAMSCSTLRARPGSRAT